MPPKNRLTEMFLINYWSCRRLQPLLVPYAENSLTTQVRARVEAHLSSCVSCRSEVATLEEMSRLLQSGIPHGKPFTPAPDLWSRIEAQIVTPAPAPLAPAPQPATWGQTIRLGAPVFAAAVVLAVVAAKNPYVLSFRPSVVSLSPSLPPSPALQSRPPASTALPTAAAFPQVSGAGGTVRQNKPAFRIAAGHKPLAVLIAAETNIPRPDPFAPMGEKGRSLSRSFSFKRTPQLHSAAARTAFVQTGDRTASEIRQSSPSLPDGSVAWAAATPLNTSSGKTTLHSPAMSESPGAASGPLLDGDIVRSAAIPRARIVQVAFEPASELRPLTAWETTGGSKSAAAAAANGLNRSPLREPQVKRRGNQAIARASFSAFPGVTPPVDALLNRMVPAAEVSDAANGARRRRELFSFGAR